jgi:hypothetical protein
MNVHLHQRLVADARETVDLTSLDDEHIAGRSLERFAIYDVPAATALDELNFVVRMPMRLRPAPRAAVEEEDRHAGIAVIGTDELIRASDEGQLLYVCAMHGSIVPRMASVPIVTFPFSLGRALSSL